MPSRKKETLENPPTSIDPYETLGVEKTATQDQVKSGYRKQALKHHPGRLNPRFAHCMLLELTDTSLDKVAPSEKEIANKQFQEIAFAYAILSNERRRKRYDTTGNTSESLALDDDDFNWTDYFREQYSAVLTGDALDKVKKEYQGSEEEKRDLLDAFVRFNGNMDKIYSDVMCSNVLDDDKRFRSIIDQAIEDNEVEGWNKYVKEPEKKRVQRRQRAEWEAEEAEDLAEELGVKDKLGMTGKKRKDEGMGDLAALIQQRQQGRAANFFDGLEAKYGGGKKTGKKRMMEEEPPEEAFQKTGARAKKGRKQGEGGI